MVFDTGMPSNDDDTSDDDAKDKEVVVFSSTSSSNATTAKEDKEEKEKRTRTTKRERRKKKPGVVVVVITSSSQRTLFCGILKTSVMSVKKRTFKPKSLFTRVSFFCVKIIKKKMSRSSLSRIGGLRREATFTTTRRRKRLKRIRRSDHVFSSSSSSSSSSYFKLEKEEGGGEENEEILLLTPEEVIENLPSILLESELEGTTGDDNNGGVVDLVEFSTLCKEYVKNNGDVDALVRKFSESEYNSSQFLEAAFDTVYDAKMAMRKNEVSVEVFGAFQEICLICAKAFRKRNMKPEVFLADECVKEISQSRYKAKLFKDDEAIERARWKVRRMLVESFVDKELYGSKEVKEEGEGKTKQTLLDFAKFARQLSICRSTALEDMEKNISFATERMGMSEILIEGATEKALNKPDDLEITKKAMERVVNSVDEVLALCLELDLEKKNNPATTRVMKAEQLLRKNREFLDDDENV